MLKYILNYFYLQTIAHCKKMSGKTAMERVKHKTEIIKQSVDELKNELNFLTKEYNRMLGEQLKEENARLLEAVESAKKHLVALEDKKGIKQVPIPTQKSFSSETKDKSENMLKEAVIEKQLDAPKQNEKKENKGKKSKEQKEPHAELPINIGRLDLRIGKVENVERHPDADSLYVLKINCGEDKLRTVCSGLVKYVPMEELQNRTVVLLCNLKPVKMRGITSEAMVMCASSEVGVEVLTPPESSVPGDLVYCEGYTRQPDIVMNPKKKIFETVAPDLHTNDNLEACYKNVPFMVTGKNGCCVSKSLKNVPVK